MKGEHARRRASVLVILAAGLWVHAWLPALFVVALVVWALLHRRLEGKLGRDVLRLWHRIWPPATLALVPLIVASGVAYWVSDAAITTKALPITLNLLALSMVVVERCRWVVARGSWVRGAEAKSPSTRPSVASSGLIDPAEARPGC